MRTTREWQQLLEGTTEGPWEYESSDYGVKEITADVPVDKHSIAYMNGLRTRTVEVIGEGGQMGGCGGDHEDLRLAASAPEAVAEIVRLRQGMENLEGLINANLALVEEVGEYEWYIAPYRNIAEAIRTILEGDKS